MKGSAALPPVLRPPAKKPKDDTFPLRVAIASSLQAIGSTSAIPVGSDAEVIVRYLLRFLLQEGVCDDHEEVRDAMVSAGRALIDSYGQNLCAPIVETLEVTLNEDISSTKDDNERFDRRHEAAVILLGSAGKHLSKEDPQMITILESLVLALNTPVGSIQRAVADCLIPLVQCLKTDDRIKDMLESLIAQVHIVYVYATLFHIMMFNVNIVFVWHGVWCRP